MESKHAKIRKTKQKYWANCVGKRIITCRKLSKMSNDDTVGVGIPAKGKKKKKKMSLKQKKKRGGGIKDPIIIPQADTH